MSDRLERPATDERLFLWVMHRFAEVFKQHAILRGGMALRLHECQRSTTDVDYVFVPYTSKKEIAGRIEDTLRGLQDADVRITMNSKALRADVRLDDAQIQVEVSVDQECPSESMATASLADSLGIPSHVVRVMAPDTSLSHKLAAWNERRLHRDLYDTYFLVSRIGATPELDLLKRRLAKIESRLPSMKKTCSMDLATFGSVLRCAVGDLTQVDLERELAPLLPANELAGLASRIRSTVTQLVEPWAG